MEVELNSDWLVNQIELLKSLHGYEMKEINEEIGSIDYIANEGGLKRFLRVIIDPKSNVSKALTDATRKTMFLIEREGYDEAVILAEEITQGSKTLIRGKDNINYISIENECQQSISDLLYAIEKKTGELCKSICGKVPKKESNCKGYQDGEYSCPVRIISDNVDFHADRVWLQLLMNDFYQLVKLQRKMNE